MTTDAGRKFSEYIEHVKRELAEARTGREGLLEHHPFLVFHPAEENSPSAQISSREENYTSSTEQIPSPYVSWPIQMRVL